MIVAKIAGGLGNQMFQYATAKALAEQLKKELYLDTHTFSQVIPNVDSRTFELDIFPNILPRFISHGQTKSFYHTSGLESRLRKLIGLPFKKVFTEKKHGYNEEINYVSPPVLIDGYFQTEKYFEPYRDMIFNQFQFPELLLEDVNLSVLKNIQKSVSVAVHVRRGDYVKYTPTNSFHGVCGLDYYKRALSYFVDRDKDCFFYFFSDDPEWVAENLLRPDLNASLVDNNKDKNSWKDMYLMSQCKHNVIANSSFSWWGAWLNRNAAKIVIAPNRWFQSSDPFYEPNDIIPGNWIKM